MANQSPEVARYWSDAEMEALRRLYLAGRPVDDIVMALRRSRSSIRGKLKKMGVSRNRNTPWTKEHDAAVQVDRPIADIARELGRTPLAVSHRRHRLGFRIRDMPEKVARIGRAIEAVEGGRTAREAAEAEGLSQATVRLHAIQQGVNPNLRKTAEQPELFDCEIHRLRIAGRTARPIAMEMRLPLSYVYRRLRNELLRTAIEG